MKVGMHRLGRSSSRASSSPTSSPWSATTTPPASASSSPTAATRLVEGGRTDTYTVRLTKAPTGHGRPAAHAAGDAPPRSHRGPASRTLTAAVTPAAPPQVTLDQATVDLHRDQLVDPGHVTVDRRSSTSVVDGSADPGVRADRPPAHRHPGPALRRRRRATPNPPCSTSALDDYLPWLLPGEQSGHPTPIDQPESRGRRGPSRSTRLVVHNEDSPADDVGTLTSDRITGLGHGRRPDRRRPPAARRHHLRRPRGPQHPAGLRQRPVHGRVHPHRYDDARPGAGNDDLTSAPSTATRWSAAATATTPSVGRHRPAGPGVDRIRAQLALDGGAGGDTVDARRRRRHRPQPRAAHPDQPHRAGHDRPRRRRPAVLRAAAAPAPPRSRSSLAGVRQRHPGGRRDRRAVARRALRPALPGRHVLRHRRPDPLCSDSVWVWKVGSVYLIGFRGELDRVDRAGAGRPRHRRRRRPTALRVDGITYAGLASDNVLDIALGSGDDVMNVQGTLARTNLSLGAGDDRDLRLLAGRRRRSTAARTSSPARSTTSTARSTSPPATAATRCWSATRRPAPAIANVPDHPQLARGAGAATPQVATGTRSLRGRPGHRRHHLRRLGDRQLRRRHPDLDRLRQRHPRVEAPYKRTPPAPRTTTWLNTGLGDDTVDADARQASVDGAFMLNTQGPYQDVLDLRTDLSPGDEPVPADIDRRPPQRQRRSTREVLPRPRPRHDRAAVHPGRRRRPDRRDHPLHRRRVVPRRRHLDQRGPRDRALRRPAADALRRGHRRRLRLDPPAGGLRRPGRRHDQGRHRQRHHRRRPRPRAVVRPGRPSRRRGSAARSSPPPSCRRSQDLAVGVAGSAAWATAPTTPTARSASSSPSTRPSAARTSSPSGTGADVVLGGAASDTDHHRPQRRPTRTSSSATTASSTTSSATATRPTWTRLEHRPDPRRRRHHRHRRGRRHRLGGAGSDTIDAGNGPTSSPATTRSYIGRSSCRSPASCSCSPGCSRPPTPSVGGADVIITGSGLDVVLGGADGDVVRAGGGDDLRGRRQRHRPLGGPRRRASSVRQARRHRQRRRRRRRALRPGRRRRAGRRHPRRRHRRRHRARPDLRRQRLAGPHRDLRHLHQPALPGRSTAPRSYDAARQRPGPRGTSCSTTRPGTRRGATS